MALKAFPHTSSIGSMWVASMHRYFVVDADSRSSKVARGRLGGVG